MPESPQRIPDHGSLLCWALIAALAACISHCPAATNSFDHTHALLTRVLERHVKDARVDYVKLKRDPATLDEYLGLTAKVSKTDFGSWNQQEQLAFLCNVYNSRTLRLIIDHHPVRSIKSIGSFVQGPWDRPVVLLFGDSLTLNQLEHEVIRGNHAEPRIHFALVCAAKGCPPLRREAYTGAQLEVQLEDQARRFLASSSQNRVEAPKRTVHLSPIFKWYAEDFEKKHGSVLAAIRDYWPDNAGAGILPGFTIRYTHYDWSLNEQPK